MRKEILLSTACAFFLVLGGLSLNTLGCGSDDDHTCPTCEPSDDGDDGADNKGTGPGGLPGEGTTDEDATTEGTTDEGATDEGTTDEDATTEGTTDEGTTDEDATTEGTTDEGVTTEGTTDEGVTTEGTTDEGATDDGTSTDGEPAGSMEACYTSDDPCKCFADAGFPEYCGTTDGGESGEACFTLCPEASASDLDIACTEFLTCAFASGSAFTEEACPACVDAEVCTDCAICEAGTEMYNDAKENAVQASSGASAPGDPQTTICPEVETTNTNSFTLTMELSVAYPGFPTFGGAVSFTGSKQYAEGWAYCVEGDAPPIGGTGKDCYLPQETKIACKRSCEVCTENSAKAKVSMWFVTGEGEQKGTKCAKVPVTTEIILPANTPLSNIPTDCKNALDGLSNGGWNQICGNAETIFKSQNKLKYNPNCGHCAGQPECCSSADGPYQKGRCVLQNPSAAVEQRYGACESRSIKHGTCPGNCSSGMFEYPCDKGFVCVTQPTSDVNCGCGIWQDRCKYWCIGDGS